MHALSGHVDWTTAPAVVQLLIGSIEQQESGGVIATVNGGQEQSGLSLEVTKMKSCLVLPL